MNSHIEKYLDQYLDLPNPDYAVMITGEWGCGKTYFIKGYIAKRESKNICYISLNGIRQCNDVVPQILLALAPKKWRSKTCKGIISFGRSLAYGITKFFNVDGVFSVKDISSFLSGNITFVFDDLERTLLDPKEILGFLSDLVEQQHFHVVIVGDESKIGEEIKKEYLFRKEKIIGKAFHIQSQATYVFPELVERIEHLYLKELLKENSKKILFEIIKINKYCQKEQVNYRIINAAIREFHFSFENVFSDDELKPYRSKIFEELFLRFLTIFYCLRTNYLSIEEVRLCTKTFIIEDEKSDKVNEFRAEFSFFITKPFIPLEIWFSIFEHKQVDQNELITHIRDMVIPEVPNWENLWHFWEMEDSDIEQAYNAVLQDLAVQKYRNIHEIIHAFMTQIDMAKKGFIDVAPSAIIAEAKKYMDLLGEKLNWNDVTADVDFNWKFSGGYGYHSADSEEFEEITSYLKNKILEKSSRNRNALYQDFIRNITNDEGSFLKICSYSYRHADIFSDSDPQVLWDKLIGLKPAAFEKITHYMNKEVIPDLLLKYGNQVVYWRKIVDLGECFLKDHPRDNKAKCLQIKEFFLPPLKKLVYNDAQS